MLTNYKRILEAHMKSKSYLNVRYKKLNCKLQDDLPIYI